MKIAIMTSIAPENYGTSLQSCALLRFLNNCDFDAKVVQYYARRKNYKQRIGFFFFPRVKKELFRFTHKNIVGKRGKKHFDYFQKKYIRLTELCDSTEDLKKLNNQYDVFICGSDQIWSPLGFDEHYFLDFVKEPKKMIPYAPSFGVYTIRNRYAKKSMKPLLERFPVLSVRESTGVKILREEFDLEAHNVADPALLFSSEEWDEILGLSDEKEKEPYLLAYFLGDSRKNWKKTEELAEVLNLKLMIVPVFQKDLSREGVLNESLGPKEFVRLVRNATCVCTDSFHGLLFSLIYRKKTYCFRRFNEKSRLCENSRVIDILKIAGLSQRLLDGEVLAEIVDDDYALIKKNLTIFSNKSKEYLTDALKRIEQENKK